MSTATADSSPVVVKVKDLRPIYRSNYNHKLVVRLVAEDVDIRHGATIKHTGVLYEDAKGRLTVRPRDNFMALFSRVQ